MKEYVVTRKNRLTHYINEERYSESEVKRAADFLGIPKTDLLRLAMKNAKKIIVEDVTVEDLIRRDRKLAAILEYKRTHDVSVVEAKETVEAMIEKIETEESKEKKANEN